MINPEIFKAYDIRGIYGSDFDDEAAYQIALAFVALKKQDPDFDASRPIKIGVGGDMRVSTPNLKSKLIAGLIAAGAEVIDFGMVSTPAFYFAIASNGLSGGIMVSASHNPKEWNGFKLVRSKAVPVSEDTGIMWMKEQVLSGNLQPSATPGQSVEYQEIAKKQLIHDQTYIHLDNIKPLTIVVDTANGMGAQYITELFKKLPLINLIPLNFNFDGTFPNHEADPLKEENLVQLKKAILDNKADLGIATDGDGDRIFFVDNNGETVAPAIVRGLLARTFLKDKPGSKIGYDVRPGKITPDMILENGGLPVITRVGHSLIKEQMLKENIYFAGESSGHFFLNLPLGCFEMPNIMIGRLLEEFSNCGQPLAEYLKPLRRYFSSGEINSVVQNKEAVIKAIGEKYSDAKLSFLDGITVEYPDYWFNVRASNTENKIRLNLEAINEPLMAEKRDEVLTLIRQY